jgi:hypothetical protein
MQEIDCYPKRQKQHNAEKQNTYEKRVKESKRRLAIVQTKIVQQGHHTAEDWGGAAGSSNTRHRE